MLSPGLSVGRERRGVERDIVKAVEILAMMIIFVVAAALNVK